MKVGDAIREAQALIGGSVPDASMLRWLSELDGRLAFDFYKADAWMPYTAADANADLLLPYPWDGRVYVPHLEAMAYYERAEMDRYENARVLSETAIKEFRQYVHRTFLPLCPQ